ncbi:MAG: amidohydrolase family protein, partial [Clostridia bacterium]|nr:amidohydrolase family protein [Clostridia bacterium]
NKILFGTDCPWDCQKDDVLYFNNLDLTEEVKEKILYKNALELLK